MRRATLFACLVVPSLSAVLFALLGRGSQTSHHVLGRFAMPLLLLCLVAAALLAFRHTRAALLACLAALAVVLSVFAAVGAGRIAVALDTRALAVRAEGLVPALDHFRATNGRYPVTLSSLGLRTHHSVGACFLMYSGHSDSFSFFIPDPLIGSRSRDWHSRDRRWRTVLNPGIWQ